MKRILEIGGGRTPYFIRYETDFDPRDTYTSIDISEENIKFAKEKLAEWQRKGEFTPKASEFICMDANSTSFPDEFFDAIVISNTLSAPVHNNWDKNGDFITTGGHDGKTIRKIEKKHKSDDPFMIERQAILSEAMRVLKKDGVLSIYTDLIIYGIDSYRKILNQMKNDSRFFYQEDKGEQARINELNMRKLASGEFCSCFRAEVLPESEVHRFHRQEAFSI